MRQRAVAELSGLEGTYPKLLFGDGMRKAYLDPPKNPGECIFARVTQCISADLKTVVTPCQFGGNPNCAECGCVASIGLHAIGRHRLAGKVPVGSIFEASIRTGSAVRRVRELVAAG
jgi:hypothetical protein